MRTAPLFHRIDYRASLHKPLITDRFQHYLLAILLAQIVQRFEADAFEEGTKNAGSGSKSHRIIYPPQADEKDQGSVGEKLS